MDLFIRQFWSTAINFWRPTAKARQLAASGPLRPTANDGFQIGYLMKLALFLVIFPSVGALTACVPFPHEQA